MTCKKSGKDVSQSSEASSARLVALTRLLWVSDELGEDQQRPSSPKRLPLGPRSVVLQAQVRVEVVEDHRAVGRLLQGRLQEEVGGEAEEGGAC